MAKSARQFLTAVRSNLSELKGLRYISSTATADGSTTGLTLIDSTLSPYQDDHFVGCTIKIASDHRRPLISDFVSSTFTITVGDGVTASTGFGRRATIGVAYEIMEKGIWDDSQILEWLAQAQNNLLNLLSDDALVTVAKTTTTAGTLGDSAMPTDFIRLISLLVSDSGSTTEFNGTALLNPEEEWRFEKDSFIGTSSSPVVVFRGGRVKYRPAENRTLLWSYIGKLADISSSQDALWPDEFFGLLCAMTTARAFQASEDMASATIWQRIAMEEITARNAQMTGDTKLSKMTEGFANSYSKRKTA